MRTQEEITAACERRMAELEAAAKDKRDRTVPNPEKPHCSTCKWHVGHAGCNEPLVKGFDATARAWDDYAYQSAAVGKPVALCGAEKALWTPRPPATWWQRNEGWAGPTLVIGAVALAIVTPAIVCGVIWGWLAAACALGVTILLACIACPP